MFPRIRDGHDSDVESVLLLWTRSQIEPSHTDDVESLRALVAHDPAALIVAEDDGRVVGSVVAAWDGWRGTIYRLVVAPSHRRMGLAGQLLHRAQIRLNEVGAVRLQAIVVETDESATGFWKATGWDQQVERLRFVKG
jgi:ribosomal protein S18 acetylase RimI-like enzyme